MIDYKELSQLADQVGQTAGQYAKDSSRLVAAWQRVDKDVMKQMIQSLYHIRWNLKDLCRNMTEITGLTAVVPPSTLEDIRYMDYDTINRVMLIERTKTWYANVKVLHDHMTRILKILDAVDARPKITSYVNARLWLDLDFFSDQFQTAVGEKID